MKPENARRFLVWSFFTDLAFLLALLVDVFVYAGAYVWPIVAAYAGFVVAVLIVLFVTPPARGPAPVAAPTPA